MNTKYSLFTDVSDLAHKLNPEYQANGYSKVFVGDRGDSFLVARLATNINEHFEEEEGVYLVEINVIDKENLADTLTDENTRKLLVDDSFDNWEYESFDSEKNALVFICHYS